MRAALLATLLLTACSKDAQDKLPPLVDAITIQQSDVVSALNAVGNVRFARETPVGFSEGGRVSSLRFKEGDRVARGQLLAVLSGIAPKAAPPSSSAELEKALARFEQIKTLQAQGYATNKQYAAAEAAALAVEGGQQPAGAVGEEVYAPTSGVILSRLVQTGQNVSAGTAALVLGEDEDGFVLRAMLSERDAAKLKKGMAARIVVEALGPKPVDALIADIEKAPGGAAIILKLPSNSALRAGQIGSVIIDLPEGAGGSFKVPASALAGIKPTQALVYILDPKTKRLEARSVLLEGGSEGNAIISSGIKVGDVIVIPRGKKLRTGMKVRIAP